MQRIVKARVGRLRFTAGTEIPRRYLVPSKSSGLLPSAHRTPPTAAPH